MRALIGHAVSLLRRTLRKGQLVLAVHSPSRRSQSRLSYSGSRLATALGLACRHGPKLEVIVLVCTR